MVLGAMLVVLGGVTCAQPWLHDGGLAWVLVWPGAALVVVGVAHLFELRDVFGKRPDGTLGNVRVLVLLPFLAFTWGTWHLARVASRESALDALSPDLLIGRRLVGRELPAKVDFVVDLTAEFREVVRARGYLNLGILDGGVPDRSDLRRALDAVPRGAITFVHCAQGHGRTALFAACLLIDREDVEADAAIARVLAARPRARMGASQRAFVTEFAAQRRRSRAR